MKRLSSVRSKNSNACTEASPNFDQRSLPGVLALVLGVAEESSPDERKSRRDGQWQAVSYDLNRSTVCAARLNATGAQATNFASLAKRGRDSF